MEFDGNWQNEDGNFEEWKMGVEKMMNVEVSVGCTLCLDSSTIFCL